MVRRSAFLDAGGFHPRLEIGGEETHLAFGLATRGWELPASTPWWPATTPIRGGERARRRAQLMRNEL